MPRFIAGKRPRRLVTWLIAGGLFVFGCLLGWLQDTLPINGIPGINNRLAALVLLLVVVPLLLPLAHLRHPRPHWVRPVLLQVGSGLIAYMVVYQILVHSLTNYIRVYSPLTMTLALIVVAWLIGSGIAAGAISIAHYFRRPVFDYHYCPHCNYDLQAATSDCCPECGRERDEGKDSGARI